MAIELEGFSNGYSMHIVLKIANNSNHKCVLKRYGITYFFCKLCVTCYGTSRICLQVEQVRSKIHLPPLHLTIKLHKLLVRNHFDRSRLVGYFRGVIFSVRL